MGNLLIWINVFSSVFIGLCPCFNLFTFNNREVKPTIFNIAYPLEILMYRILYRFHYVSILLQLKPIYRSVLQALLPVHYENKCLHRFLMSCWYIPHNSWRTWRNGLFNGLLLFNTNFTWNTFVTLFFLITSLLSLNFEIIIFIP